MNALKQEGQRGGTGAEGRRLQSMLAVSQLSLALLLLVASGLMYRSSQALKDVDPGFRQPEDVMTIGLYMDAATIPEREEAARVQEFVARRLGEVSGVSSVGRHGVRPSRSDGLGVSTFTNGATVSPRLACRDPPTSLLRSVVMIRLRNLVVPLALLAFTAPAVAQDSTATIAAQMDLLRSDVQAAKDTVIEEALGLTDEQSQAFWPIYRAYQAKLAAIGNRRLENIKRFSDNFTTMTDQVGAEIAAEWFGQQNDRLELLRSTHGEVEEAIGGMLAARWVQVEHTLTMLIDIQVAAALPLIQ